MPRPSLEAQDAARRLIAGETAAFDDLVRIYSPDFRELWWVKRQGLDPEDVAQEVWLQCWTRLDLLRRPDLVDFWIKQTMREVLCCVPRPIPIPDPHPTFRPLSRSIPDPRARRRMSTDWISIRMSVPKAMAKLPRHWRGALEAVMLMGYTYSEMAERLPYSAGAIRKMVISGMRELREECAGRKSPGRIGKSD